MLQYLKINFIDSKYFKRLKNILYNEKLANEYEIISFLNNFFNQKDKKVSIQKMIRMTKNDQIDIDISEVLQIDEDSKEYYFNSFDHCNDLEYKKNKWENLKKYKYLNGIIKNNQIVSVGFVSNIDYNYANIVIQTREKYKNNGYGKCIVEKISRDLLKDGYMPIYWVNEENIPSIKLAKSLNFKPFIKEIVVKENKNI